MFRKPLNDRLEYLSNRCKITGRRDASLLRGGRKIPRESDCHEYFSAGVWVHAGLRNEDSETL